MITRAQKVRLGLFLAVSMGLLIGSVIVVAGLEFASGRDYYTVRYTTSMSGLEAGASVKYNGVRVGIVETVRINPQNVSEVVVTLKLDKGTPIKVDTKATVNLTGITGLKFVELNGGTSQSAMLQPGSEIQPGESTLDMLTGRAESIAEKIELALNQINKAISDENRERLFKVVDHVDELIVKATATLDDNRDDVRQVIANLRVASEAAAQTVQTLEREGTASLVAVRQMAEGLRDSVDKAQVTRIMANVEKVSASVRTAVDQADLPAVGAQVKNLMVVARRVVDNVDLTVVRGREGIQASLAYLQEGLENFSEFANSIRENPSLLFSAPKETER